MSAATRSITHPQARFTADLASVIEAHSIVHHAPAEIWQDGLYVGNGDLAATVFGAPGHTRVLLNKGDLWDERPDWHDEKYNPAEFDWQGRRAAIIRMIETGEEVPLHQPEVRRREGDKGNYSAFVAGGYLDILGVFPEGFTGFEQTLSLYRGTVECRFTSRGEEFGYRAYTHADDNLLAFDLDTGDPAAWPLGFQLHRDLIPFRSAYTPDPDLRPPQFGHDADSLWMTMTFPDGFGFAAVARVPDAKLEFEEADDRVTAHLRGSKERKVAVRLTIVTAEKADPADLVRQGQAQLADFEKRQIGIEGHEAWWADFWSRSWISLPDKLVENCWYIEIYKMASCSRKGGQAPGQLAHWNGFPDAPWRGDYHTNINVQENYWPIYTANHPELGWPFYDLYKGILDFMIADTRRYTGMPGARFVRGHGRSGRPYGRGADWEMWPGGSAWLSAHFWWHYQFTRDEAFLRDTYPLMRASLDYFVACVGEPDEEGVYNIIPSVAHEQSVRPPVVGAAGPWGRNSSYELGLFRELLMHTIRASEILDVDEEERAKWRDILDNLAAYPVSPDGWFEEWEGISLWESHRHLSPLYPVYPGEEIHQDVDEGAVRVGRQSVLRFLARGSDGYTGFSFGWMAACAARMGMADEALSMIRQHLRAFVNVNGYSLLGPSMFPGLAPYTGERGDINAKLPNCESGGCFCAAINELLLRSPSGNVDARPVIRVFPAIVDKWKHVRISRLRAQGAFEITAERRGGRTAYVIVESEAGVECRIAHPWPDETAVVSCNGDPVPCAIQEGLLTFPTEPGKSYVIHPGGRPPSELERVEVVPDEEQRNMIGIGGRMERMTWRQYGELV